MKSIALKTNDSQTIDFLQQELSNLKIENLFYCVKEFKQYKNLIIHYTGEEYSLFLNKISTLLSFLVIYEFEDEFLKQIIYRNYFYFSNSERELILNNCFDIMVESKKYLKEKFNTLYKTFSKCIENNNKIFLNGFITFRLTSYIEILSNIVEEAVNGFIIEKEYQEFISLLKIYVNSQSSQTNIIHLVYSNDFTMILDENKNIIENSKDVFKAKYLSDISFSTNDYTLNTLLNVLPKKIFIHLLDNKIDEFIKTLSLIFEKKVIICTDCNICNLYKHSQKKDGQG